MSRQTNPSRQAGFTLVEMLVVAPIAILIITGFIAAMITMTADILASRERSNMTYSTQDALDRIEQDVKLSAQFLPTTGPITSPQGSNNSTAAFTKTVGVTSNLLLQEFATTGSPANTSGRSLVYYAKQPNDCAGAKTFNAPLPTQVIYFLTSSSATDYSLWRRTIIPGVSVGTNIGNVCNAPWQRNSCTTGTGGNCVTKDDLILENVTEFNVQYCVLSGSMNCSASNSPETSSAVLISLTTTQSVAGYTNSTTLTLNATRLNST